MVRLLSIFFVTYWIINLNTHLSLFFKTCDFIVFAYILLHGFSMSQGRYKKHCIVITSVDQIKKKFGVIQ